MSQTQMIDKNGMRFGAGLSAIVLVIGYVVDSPTLVAAMAIALGIGAGFGLRTSPLGAIYRAAKKIFKLRIAVEPEEAAPPRFAQLLGTLFLGASLVGFFAVDSDALGWTLALVVAGLQGLLVISGICIGCEVFLLGRRLSAKGA